MCLDNVLLNFPTFCAKDFVNHNRKDGERRERGSSLEFTYGSTYPLPGKSSTGSSEDKPSQEVAAAPMNKPAAEEASDAKPSSQSVLVSEEPRPVLVSVETSTEDLFGKANAATATQGSTLVDCSVDATVTTFSTETETEAAAENVMTQTALDLSGTVAGSTSSVLTVDQVDQTALDLDVVLASTAPTSETSLIEGKVLEIFAAMKGILRFDKDVEDYFCSKHSLADWMYRSK